MAKHCSNNAVVQGFPTPKYSRRTIPTYINKRRTASVDLPKTVNSIIETKKLSTQFDLEKNKSTSSQHRMISKNEASARDALVILK